MRQIQFKNQKFTVRGWLDMKGSEFIKLTEILEYAAIFPDEMPDSIRRFMGIAVPSAIRPMRQWREAELLQFMAAVMTDYDYGDAGGVMRNYTAALEGMIGAIRRKYVVNAAPTVAGDIPGK